MENVVLDLREPAFPPNAEGGALDYAEVRRGDDDRSQQPLIPLVAGRHRRLELIDLGKGLLVLKLVRLVVEHADDIELATHARLEMLPRLGEDRRDIRGPVDAVKP